MLFIHILAVMFSTSSCDSDRSHWTGSGRATMASQGLIRVICVDGQRCRCVYVLVLSKEKWSM